MRIKPFHALRPAEGMADKVACPPYDVVDTEEARRLAEGLPMCFLRVTRAEIELPEGTDPASDATYARAADNMQLFLNQGYLVQEDRPCLYLYRQVMGEHRQEGIVAVCHVDDYTQNVIRKHEKTRQKPENDRTRHIEAINAQGGPVFLAYRDRPEIDAMVARIRETAPLYDFIAPDGIVHTVWRIPGTDALVRAFANVPVSYIADGHHRAAGAARVAARRRAASGGDTEAEFNWFLATLFPASQLNILPYNRCVSDLKGLDEAAFLKEVRARFTVRSDVAPEVAADPKIPRHIGMYLRGRWYALSWTETPGADPVAALDVSVLQDRLLDPVLGIKDPRHDERIRFIGGIHGSRELARRVDGGLAAVAFSMFPTSMEQLMAIADTGQTMPPKSTWFEPKLRSGLLVHGL